MATALVERLLALFWGQFILNLKGFIFHFIYYNRLANALLSKTLAQDAAFLVSVGGGALSHHPLNDFS